MRCTFAHTYFLIGVDACTSRLREVEWYTEALAALGFVVIRVILGPSMSSSRRARELTGC
jgi:hypothetical protein